MVKRALEESADVNKLSPSEKLHGISNTCKLYVTKCGMSALMLVIALFACYCSVLQFVFITMGCSSTSAHYNEHKPKNKKGEARKPL